MPLPMNIGRGMFIKGVPTESEPRCIIRSICHRTRFRFGNPGPYRLHTNSTIMEESYKDREVFKVVEQMPLFPGPDCGAIDTYAERKECSERALIDYIYRSIEYPASASEKGKEGTAVVSFIVEPHGVMSDVKLVRDPGHGMGEAALTVIEQMKRDNTRWEPGLQKGQPVRVLFNMPIRFKQEQKLPD